MRNMRRKGSRCITMVDIMGNEVLEVIKWYEEQLGRKLTQSERTLIRYQCAIMYSKKPDLKDLKKFGICIDGLLYGDSKNECL